MRWLGGSPKPALLVRNQCGRINVESFCKAAYRPDGRVATPSLTAADVGSVESRKMSKALLGKAALKPRLSKTAAEVNARIR